LELKLHAFEHLNRLHANIARDFAQDHAGGKFGYLDVMAMFDTIHLDLNRIYIYGVCSPNATLCWDNAILFEFDDGSKDLPFYTEYGCGIKYCPRCLRSFVYALWNIDRLIPGGKWEYKDYPYDFLLNRYSITRMQAGLTSYTHSEATQEESLNWYAGIFPEFYTQLFSMHPEAFPEWLHPLLPTWLETMRYFVAENLYSPLFLHPMFQKVNYAGQDADAYLPSMDLEDAVVNGLNISESVVTVYSPLGYPI
jgi:hypothetical protein